MGFDGRMQLTTLEGQEQMVSQGPTAAIVPIKQLGTNGGGYFGVNSSHPLENPTYLTNMVECWSILIIPMAMVLALGFYTNRRKLGYSIFGVMLFAYLAGVFINVGQEMGGNPRISGMGIAQDHGAMEGKRYGLEPEPQPYGVSPQRLLPMVRSMGCTIRLCRSVEWSRC